MTIREVPRGILVVTGTGTGVGKTVVTAAIAAIAQARGDRVAVVKPAQTGTGPGEHADVPDCETVRRLAGVTDVHELARFPDPLSPEAAARVGGLPPLDLRAAAEHITRLAESRDLILVEGAGGLLVRYDTDGRTIAGLASALGAPVVVVAAAGLGTLNHTALTCEALAAREIESKGVVIGSWPRRPGLAERANRTDLEAVAGGPLAGVLPEGSGQLGRAEFLVVARAGLAPHLGGSRLAGSGGRSAEAGVCAPPRCRRCPGPDSDHAVRISHASKSASACVPRPCRSSKDAGYFSPSSGGKVSRIFENPSGRGRGRRPGVGSGQPWRFRFARGASHPELTQMIGDRFGIA